MKIDELFAYAVAIRRQIHQYPEVGFELPRTAALVTAELEKMGALLDLPDEGNQSIVYINGQKRLRGASNLHASDLRAGAALVIAALRADGVSEISGVELIERGYCNLTQNLRALGADIRIEDTV